MKYFTPEERIKRQRNKELRTAYWLGFFIGVTVGIAFYDLFMSSGGL